MNPVAPEFRPSTGVLSTTPPSITTTPTSSATIGNPSTPPTANLLSPFPSQPTQQQQQQQQSLSSSGSHSLSSLLNTENDTIVLPTRKNFSAGRAVGSIAGGGGNSLYPSSTSSSPMSPMLNTIGSGSNSNNSSRAISPTPPSSSVYQYPNSGTNSTLQQQGFNGNNNNNNLGNGVPSLKQLATETLQPIHQQVHPNNLPITMDAMKDIFSSSSSTSAIGGGGASSSTSNHNNLFFTNNTLDIGNQFDLTANHNNNTNDGGLGFSNYDYSDLLNASHYGFNNIASLSGLDDQELQVFLFSSSLSLLFSSRLSSSLLLASN